MEFETHNVRLVIQKGLIPKGRRIKELRSFDCGCAIGEEIVQDGRVIRCPAEICPYIRDPLQQHFAIVLEPLPQWNPPASMPNGEYKVEGNCMYPEGYFWVGHCVRFEHMAKGYRDWTAPPAEGRWKIENGKATYLG